MAIIKYGPIAQEVSGTIGGVVFHRAYASKAVRGWRQPINKRRAGQITQRQIHSRSSGRWFDTLTATQRDDWDVYATTCSFTNPLGEEYFLNGFNMYVRNNNIASTFDFSPITTRPTADGFPSIVEFTFVLNHILGTLSLTAVYPDPPPAADWLFEIHTLRKSSKRFPVPHIITRTVIGSTQGLPVVLHTYTSPLPGATGDIQALVYWYLRDEDYRVSKPSLALVISE